MRERPSGRRWLLGAGCEIVAPNGRLLLIEQERHGQIEWSGTGGALEPDESIEDAARREALEESGLRVRLERLIAVSEFWERGHFTGVGFLFLATPDPWPQEVRLPAVDGLTRFRSHRWVRREEVDAVDGRWEHHISRLAWPADIEHPLVLHLDTAVTPRIRRARDDEAAELTALARRSKAHWGYPPELLERMAPHVVVTADQIARNEVWVLEGDEGFVIGFHQVVVGDPATLDDLWVEPSAIGRGNGRRLWEHAVAIARLHGASALELDADPNAVTFYERRGAVRIADTPSPLGGDRRLPRMRFRLG